MCDRCAQKKYYFRKNKSLYKINHQFVCKYLWTFSKDRGKGTTLILIYKLIKSRINVFANEVLQFQKGLSLIKVLEI